MQVEEGISILKAAEKVGVKVPTLCYHPDLPAWAACGICVVKIEGSPKMLRACATPVADGMSIITHDPEIVEVRRTVIELILSTHPTIVGMRQKPELRASEDLLLSSAYARCPSKSG
jgi:NADH-quinone oxidoreductase subunit G